MQKRQRKVVTLVDVAQAAGVSSATVSRVINGHSQVRDATRSRVNAAIERLDFSPNLAARMLAGAKEMRICLLYTNPSSSYLGELLLGAVTASSEVGASLVVEYVEEGVSTHYLRDKLLNQWDGIIVPPPICDFNSIQELVSDGSKPSVLLSSSMEVRRAHVMRIDDFLAARQVTEMLIAKGHREIAFIKGHPRQSVSESRYNGYIEAMSQVVENVRPDLIEQGFFTYRSGMDAAAKLLAQSDPPSAIFASNDDMAAGAIAAANKLGLSVPKELSVVGFDDSPMANSVWPPLTTVRQPVAEMAAEAVRIVRADFDNVGGSQQPLNVDMDHFIVERESVAAPHLRPQR